MLLSTDSDTVELVVRFGFFNENLQQIRRRINYGPIVEGCTSHLVTVRRLTDGCWEVESMAPTDEACVFKGIGRGKNASIELQGTYHMPFLLTLQEITGTDDTGPILASCEPPPL